VPPKIRLVRSCLKIPFLSSNITSLVLRIFSDLRPCVELWTPCGSFPLDGLLPVALPREFLIDAFFCPPGFFSAALTGLYGFGPSS